MHKRISIHKNEIKSFICKGLTRRDPIHVKYHTYSKRQYIFNSANPRCPLATNRTYNSEMQKRNRTLIWIRISRDSLYPSETRIRHLHILVPFFSRCAFSFSSLILSFSTREAKGLFPGRSIHSSFLLAAFSRSFFFCSSSLFSCSDCIFSFLDKLSSTLPYTLTSECTVLFESTKLSGMRGISCFTPWKTVDLDEECSS